MMRQAIEHVQTLVWTRRNCRAILQAWKLTVGAEFVAWTFGYKHDQTFCMSGRQIGRELLFAWGRRGQGDQIRLSRCREQACRGVAGEKLGPSVNGEDGRNYDLGNGRIGP
ncbi:hypothetical protein L1987_83687 [Smallanthus sonchifolius]|uniref:Uncharacterized protein n=1 Tax=Smallanthus sonchifolius TaxID=185202 RepID=A0ACB8YCJ6_9ASTR|nr:hypothetical protein L1987_83687 [Smallanthus sonchifolius]